MVRARIAGLRKGIAGLLCDRPSADSLRADSGEIRAGHYGNAAAIAESVADADRRTDRRGAEWHLQKKRQTVLDGDARRFGRLGPGALHERELRQVSRTVAASKSHPRGRRSE